MSILQMRLKNCLQTILELEPDIRAGSWGEHFGKELHILKKYLAQVDHMKLAEEDVQHMEKITSTFLTELKLVMGTPRAKRILQ